MGNRMGIARESCAFINSDKKITVCGCVSVESYTDEEIVICLVEMKLKLNGSNMTMSTFSGGEIAVCGELSSIEFLKGRCSK